MAFYDEWDKSGERFYETGVDRGVLYPQAADGTYENGVYWNGLTSVQVQPSGGEANPQYADNRKYLNLFSVEEIGATIEAFQYPDEFEACNGAAPLGAKSKMYARTQTRKAFGFTWRSKVGNDTNDDAGYKIHILYGCKASPSEMQYQTVNESPEAATMSWTITTTPPSIGIDGLKDTALFEVDTTNYTMPDTNITWLENKLYGIAGSGSTTGTEPAMPTIAELVEHFVPQG